MNSPRYKAALIGCGNRSRKHVESYEHVPEAALTACCDLIEERRAGHAAEYGLTAYADAAEMIERERPDIVHIVTQPADRAELMHLVADLEVPASVVEKPLAAGVTDWRSLVALERRSSTRFTVSHQFRWHIDLTRCREALQSGRLGAVRFLETSCGMNVSNQGTHALNYVMSLNGDARVHTLFGTASGMSGSDPTHPAPDTSVAHLLFDNGVRCLWHHGTTAPLIGDPATTYQHLRAAAYAARARWPHARTAPLTGHPATTSQHVRVAAYAERGRVLYEEFRNWEIVGPDGTECGHVGATWNANNLLAQAGLTRATLNWLEDGAALPGTNLNQSLHEFKTVLALYASTLRRQPIELASFEPEDDLFEQLTAVLS